MLVVIKSVTKKVTGCPRMTSCICEKYGTLSLYNSYSVNYHCVKRALIQFETLLLPGSMFDSSLGKWLVFPQCTSQTLPCQFQKH